MLNNKKENLVGLSYGCHKSTTLFFLNSNGKKFFKSRLNFSGFLRIFNVFLFLEEALLYGQLNDGEEGL